MKSRFWVMILLLMPLCSAWAQSSSPVVNDTSRAEAKRLFEAMQMKKTMHLIMQSVLETQLKNKPEMAQFKEEFETFLNKHLSYEAILPEITELYAETFTVNEMVEIARFYESPVGQRSLELLPQLAARSQQIALQRIEANKAELLDMVLKRMMVLRGIAAVEP